MNFLNPLGLALAVAAVPIVFFYILKIRLRRVPVSTLMFWRQIFEEKKPRSIWQKLRHWVSLLLQLAFLALLIFALADPIFRWQQSHARRLVIILDNSASMNAVDVAPSRLAAAKNEARKLIEGLRLGDEMAVIAAGTHSQVYSGFTDHQRTLREAIEAIKPSDGPTRVTEAVGLARRLISGSDKTHEIVILSDGAFDNVPELVALPHTTLVSFNTKPANLGITCLQARRSLLDPIGYEILVEVQNASDEPQSCRLELDLDEQPIDVIPLQLQPGEHLTRIFEKTSADGGRLRASIDLPDALATDNQAWAILPAREPLPLALVTEGNLFLEKVFEAIPLVELTISRPDQPPPTGALVTVFHRKTPAVLPPGPVLVIEPLESNALWLVEEAIQNPLVAKLDKDSQILAHVRLDQVLLPEARKLKFKAPAQVLAETATGDPLYAIIDRPEGKVVVLSVNLDKSDLPLQTAFPIMMANLLAWFAEGKGELREAHSTGEIVEVDLAHPSDADFELMLRSPAGKEQALPKGQTKIAIGPLDQCGIWTVLRRTSSPNSDEARNADANRSDRDNAVAEIACNLSSRRESDLRAPENLTSRTHDLAGGFGGRPIWFYLLAVAALFTCWEWYLYQRRWID